MTCFDHLPFDTGSGDMAFDEANNRQVHSGVKKQYDLFL